MMKGDNSDTFRVECQGSFSRFFASVLGAILLFFGTNEGVCSGFISNDRIYYNILHIHDSALPAAEELLY